MFGLWGTLAGALVVESVYVSWPSILGIMFCSPAKGRSGDVPGISVLFPGGISQSPYHPGV